MTNPLFDLPLGPGHGPHIPDRASLEATRAALIPDPQPQLPELQSSEDIDLEIARLVDHPTSAHGSTVPQLEGTDPDYDKTQLSMLQGMNLMRIHRDYLAHAIRYEFVLQRIKKSREQAMVLDVGCADVPLMRAMRSSMLRPTLYHGLDVRAKLIQKCLDYYSTHHVHFPYKIECRDVTEVEDSLLDQAWTQIICMEVIEHMPKGRGQILLEKLGQAAAQGGRIYLSTPCFDGQRKAKHHKYEYGYDELEQMIKDAGLEVLHRWGTFANLRDLKRALTPAQKEVWEGLSEEHGGYYGPVALSLIFAPLHPHLSRNAIWELGV